MKNTNFTEHLTITATPKEKSDLLEVSQDCWLITSALFQVISMASDNIKTANVDGVMSDAEAIYRVALLGAVFSNIAWNSVDNYLLQQNKNGGQQK